MVDMVVTEEDMEVTEEDMEGMVGAREKVTEDMEEGMDMEEVMDMEEAMDMEEDMGMEEDMDTVVMEVKLPSLSLSHAYNCQYHQFGSFLFTPSLLIRVFP